MNRGTTTGQRGPGRQFTLVGALVAALVIVVGVLLVVWAIEAWRGDEPTVPQTGVTISNVQDDPELYFGEQLTLAGEVTSVLSDRVFVIGNDGVLVVLEEGADQGGVEITEGAEVLVEGVVHDPEASDVRDQVPPGAVEEFEGNAAMIASRVAPPTENGLPVDPPEERARQVWEVLDDFEQHEGQHMTLVGAVARTIDERSALFGGLTVDDDAMIMVGDVPEGVFTINVRALVTGTVHTFSIDDAESQLGVELDRGMLEDFEGDPAIYVEEFLLLPFPENIRMDPTAFLEEPVETIGSVGEVYAPEVFELDNEILVFTPGMDADPITGADALIRGTVGIVDRELTPQETGLELTPEFLEEWEGHPYLLADEVEIFR